MEKRLKENEYLINNLTPEFSYLIAKLPGNLFTEVDNYINYLKNNKFNGTPANNDLVGFIENEFYLKLDDNLIETIKSLAFELDKVSHYSEKCTNFFGDIKGFDLEDTGPWVNFQKKHEFNPIHCHKGLYSYTIWHTIPYDLNLEKSQTPNKNIYSLNEITSFNFHYFQHNKINTFPIQLDKKYEKCICIFPSILSHSVNPFYTSDEYRISIAGNLAAKIIY